MENDGNGNIEEKRQRFVFDKMNLAIKHSQRL